MAGQGQGCRAGQQPPTGSLAVRLAGKEQVRRAEHERWAKQLGGARAA
ncbi:hypothetical protein [Actinoplanes regularis]|nr:hypothetical protein [Actinoplanes regularis]GLW32293.1 hypothetical protein Areg01_52320 [Actinoplanes regularis]